MKKTYIAPLSQEIKLVGHQMIATSVTGVGGDTGIGIGTGPTPGEAGTKEYNDWNIWDK